MKTPFSILILLLLTTLAGCSQDYTITGSIDGAIDGDSVILGYSADGENFTTVDKTTVENGLFHFSGKTKGSKIYYIGYEQSIEPMYMLFFLEAGDISIQMAANNGIVTGTSSNDLNNEIEKTTMRYVETMLDADFKLQSDTLMSDSAKAKLNLTVTEARRDATLYLRNIIEDNIESIVSLYLLVQYHDLFNIEELEELVKKIPSKNIDRKNNCIYDVLIEAINERKSTNNPQEDSYEW